jgi:hypothetical protein
MNPSAILTKYEGQVTKQAVRRYVSEIGSINWASIATRPDICYVVLMLSRFLSNPGSEHFTALEWLWGYIKWSLNYELVYNGDNSDLTAYSGVAPKAASKADISIISGYFDTDWAGCLDTRKSTGGYFILYGNCVIAWKLKLQGNVTRSSTEAEYVQLLITACEMVAFRRLLTKWLEGAITIKIKLNTQSTLTLYGDN